MVARLPEKIGVDPIGVGSHSAIGRRMDEDLLAMNVARWNRESKGGPDIGCKTGGRPAPDRCRVSADCPALGGGLSEIGSSGKETVGADWGRPLVQTIG